MRLFVAEHLPYRIRGTRQLVCQSLIHPLCSFLSHSYRQSHSYSCILLQSLRRTDRRTDIHSFQLPWIFIPNSSTNVNVCVCGFVIVDVHSAQYNNAYSRIFMNVFVCRQADMHKQTYIQFADVYKTWFLLQSILTYVHSPPYSPAGYVCMCVLVVKSLHLHVHKHTLRHTE